MQIWESQKNEDLNQETQQELATTADAVNKAISYNNLSVIELRGKRVEEALDAARKALELIEPPLTHQMNQWSNLALKSDMTF